MASLSEIADDFRERSSKYSIFDLQVFHLKDKNDDQNQFILICVNESNAEAVSVFEDWENTWRKSIYRESTEVFKTYENLVIHEYRII